MRVAHVRPLPSHHHTTNPNAAAAPTRTVKMTMSRAATPILTT